MRIKYYPPMDLEEERTAESRIQISETVPFVLPIQDTHGSQRNVKHSGLRGAAVGYVAGMLFGALAYTSGGHSIPLFNPVELGLYLIVESSIVLPIFGSLGYIFGKDSEK